EEILECITNRKGWNAKIKEQKADQEYIKGLTDEIITEFGLSISEEE
ncbi:unnamed protein product, partial [marine sediment metagenome]